MSPKRAHFVGIGGSGISGVADLADKFGYEVSGCDLEESTAYGHNIFKGHSPEHLNGVDLVVTSPAVFYQNSDNPEVLAAKQKGILITWQEFLGNTLLKGKKLICVAGTHGKSTTTAMIGKLLIDNGFDPVVVLGAKVPEWNGTSRYGRGEYAVVEADEFNDNFLNYHPDIAIINNIEFDHPDYFKSYDEVLNSFEKFKKNLAGQKVLITERDSLNKTFNLKVIGVHNQKNANMAFLLGKKLGIKEPEIIRSLEGFKGIGRRMELIADRGGVKVFDDYAHHPTAIKTTLEGLRSEFPNAKILAVVEPHGFKRTRALLSEYRGVFDSINSVIIGPIFKARDKVDPSITSQMVADVSNHKNVEAIASGELLDEKWKTINDKYDIIIVMGAGKSYVWAREIVTTLPVKFSDLTTMRVGGAIKKFIEINNEKQLPGLIEEVNKSDLPVFIIGGGSDILVSDEDYNGFVIKYTACAIYIQDTELTAEAGANWDDVVKLGIENGLQGIECLSGIPGNAGAAPIQNIGAYGQEIKDTFVSLDAYDLKNKKFVTFTNAECKFGYRESIFKTTGYWQKYLITSIKLKLNKSNRPAVKYESLENYLNQKGISDPDLNMVRESVLKIRATKFEDPKKTGNAGSFFKNPVITSAKKDELLNKYPELKYFEFDAGYKIAAGWLIEKAGWKGKTFRTASVSPSHALVLINPGQARAKDILELSNAIISDVENKFGIKLEREVQLINFKNE